MTRTLLVGVGNEVALNTPTTLENATVVRVYNGVGSTATVSVAKSTTTGYANTATFLCHKVMLNSLKKVLRIKFQHHQHQL
jgi:hypothetical protein